MTKSPVSKEQKSENKLKVTRTCVDMTYRFRCADTLIGGHTEALSERDELVPTTLEYADGVREDLVRGAFCK